MWFSGFGQWTRYFRHSDTHLEIRSSPNPLPWAWSISWRISNKVFFASHLILAVSSFALRLSTPQNLGILMLKFLGNLSCWIITLILSFRDYISRIVCQNRRPSTPWFVVEGIPFWPLVHPSFGLLNNLAISLTEFANFFWDVGVRFLSWEWWDFWRRHEHFRRFPKTSEDFRRRPKSSEDVRSLSTTYKGVINASSLPVLFTSKIRDREEGIVIYLFYTWFSFLTFSIFEFPIIHFVCPPNFA